MIDSIASCNISGWISIFADDTRCASSVRSWDDALHLQDDLELLYLWKKESNMEFNASKFEVLQYGQHKDLKDSYNYTTPDCESYIARKESLKDLGVQMSDSASFEVHIDKVVSKVKSIMGWIRRSFITRSKDFLKFLWKTYCLPHIDYASQLWAPTNPGQLVRLEGLLRTFSSWIREVSHLSYWDRLAALNLSSVQRRFQRYRAIYTFKIISGLVPNCNLQWSTNPSSGRLCSIPKAPASATGKTKSIRQDSFQYQAPVIFNSLPLEICLIDGSLATFKLHLDNYLARLPDLPLVLNGLLPPPVNQVTARNSNCIIDWARFLHFENRRPTINCY